MRPIPERKTDRLAAAAVLSALAALAVAPAAQTQRGDITPVPLCSKVPNGSFHAGYTDWTLDPCTGGFGDYDNFASATIDDLTAIGCDADAACLSISTDATWTCDKPSGSASQAQMSIERKAVVRGRYLKFKVVGGFEFYQFDEATIKYDAVVVVTDGDGNMHKCEILSWDTQGMWGCPNGIQALGAIPLETVCCDLNGTGITIGETVTIKVIWSASVLACNDCDSGLFFGTLCVDDFQFCNACLMPAELPLQATVATAPMSSANGLTVDDVSVLGRELSGEDAVLLRLVRAAAHLGIDLAAAPATDGR